MARDGHVAQDKRGRWFVDLRWQGKRYSLYRYLGHIPIADQGMAEFVLNSIRDEINKGVFNPERHKAGRPLHLAAYSETWLGLLNVSEATIKDYRNSLKNHILPALGAEFLADINFDKLRAFQKDIARSPKGKYNVMGCLHALLRDAQRSGYIPAMPEFPGFKGRDSVIPPPIRWLSDEMQWRIIEAIPEPDRGIFIFMKLTGCRPGEARALRKADVRGDHLVFANAFGAREELKEVKAKRPEPWPLTEGLKELFSILPKNLSPWVFLYSKTQKPYTHNFTALWVAAVREIGLDPKAAPLYSSVRHSFGCQLANAGVDGDVIRRLMRHSDRRMTDRYVKYRTEPLAAVVDRVQKFPGGHVAGKERRGRETS